MARRTLKSPASKLWCLAALLLLAACQPSTEVPTARAGADPCDVAIAYIDHWRTGSMKDQPFIVTNIGREWHKLNNRQMSGLLREFSKDPPPLRLMRELNRRRGPAVLESCPALTRHLNELGVKYGSEAQSAVLHLDVKGNYLAAIVSITLPIVDGDSAIMEESSTFAPEGAGGGIVHLRRDEHGKWRVVDGAATWIS